MTSVLRRNCGTSSQSKCQSAIGPRKSESRPGLLQFQCEWFGVSISTTQLISCRPCASIRLRIG